MTIQEKQKILRNSSPAGFQELGGNMKTKLDLAVDYDGMKHYEHYKQLHGDRYGDWLDNQFNLSNEERRFAKTLSKVSALAYIKKCKVRRENYFQKNSIL